MLNIDNEANNTTITLKGTNLLQLTLLENPTTGYRWQLIFDASIIVIADNYIYTGLPGVVGGGGIRTWVFQINAGVQLRLESRRVWEGKSIEAFTIKIEKE